MFIKLYTEYQRLLVVLIIFPLLALLFQPRLIPLSLGIVIIFFTAIRFVVKDLLTKKGTRVKGRIISRIDDAEWEDSKTPIVQYITTDGISIVASPTISGTLSASGQEVTVIYWPEYPKAFMLEEQEFGIISVLFILLLSGVFSLICGIMFL